MENENSDRDLQTINEDIARIILYYLQNFGRSLVALSLTCKQWQDRINLFVAKRLGHLAPNTKIDSLAHRNKIYEELSSIMESEVREIRVFEQHGTVPGPNDIAGIYPVPWNKDLVVLAHNNIFLVLDTSDGSVLHKEHATYNDMVFRIGDPICFNEHLRIIVAQTCDPAAFKTAIINVYSLTGKQVQQIDKIVSTSTNRVFVSDDGVVWLRPQLQGYSLKSKSFLDITFPELNYICGIKSNATKDGAVIYYNVEGDAESIRCFDTATRKSWIYHTHHRLVPDDPGCPHITCLPDCELIKIGTYDSALIQVVDSKFKFFMTASKMHDIQLSPDRTKFLYAKGLNVTIYSIDGNAEEYIRIMDEELFYDHVNLRNDERLCHVLTSISISDNSNRKMDKSYSYYDFRWLNNDKIFGFEKQTFVIIDLNNPQTEVKGITLLMGGKSLQGNHTQIFQVVDPQTVVVHGVTENSSVIIKIVL
eukprot:TRINITY_DN1493_c0_g3_i1.p1 TRINITY_DN1493_c0_g3~~TRINITY_DN1493_c0_g3_i1.p1  ORF type:complete len:477 (-),score=57.13 TRINITY_DN1493_c0_g3_i1:35-1465(-)